MSRKIQVTKHSFNDTCCIEHSEISLHHKCVYLWAKDWCAVTGQCCSDGTSGLYRVLLWPGLMVSVCVEVQYAAFSLITAELCVWTNMSVFLELHVRCKLVSKLVSHLLDINRRATWAGEPQMELMPLRIHHYIRYHTQYYVHLTFILILSLQWLVMHSLTWICGCSSIRMSTVMSYTDIIKQNVDYLISVFLKHTVRHLYILKH